MQGRRKWAALCREMIVIYKIRGPDVVLEIKLITG